MMKKFAGKISIVPRLVAAAFALVCLQAGAALAANAPVPGDFFYRGYEVWQDLTGVPLYIGIAMIVIFGLIMFLNRAWQFGVIALVVAGVLGGLDSVVTGLGLLG